MPLQSVDTYLVSNVDRKSQQGQFNKKKHYEKLHCIMERGLDFCSL